MAKEMTRAQLLREFFYRPGTDTLQSFMAEIKQLTDADKDELCKLIAEKLDVTVKEQN
jgi:hypothetical protein